MSGYQRQESVFSSPRRHLRHHCRANAQHAPPRSPAPAARALPPPSFTARRSGRSGGAEVMHRAVLAELVEQAAQGPVAHADDLLRGPDNGGRQQPLDALAAPTPSATPRPAKSCASPTSWRSHAGTGIAKESALARTRGRFIREQPRWALEGLAGSPLSTRSIAGATSRRSRLSTRRRERLWIR